MNKLTGYFLVISALTSACSPAEDVRPNKKLLLSDPTNTRIFIEGTWEALTPRITAEIPKINSVSIECNRSTRICIEHIAKLIRPSENPISGTSHSLLLLQEATFDVMEWSKETITARSQPRAADIDLRISLVDKSVERSSRETSARGAEGAQPNLVDHWKLE